MGIREASVLLAAAGDRKTGVGYQLGVELDVYNSIRRKFCVSKVNRRGLGLGRRDGDRRIGGEIAVGANFASNRIGDVKCDTNPP